MACLINTAVADGELPTDLYTTTDPFFLLLSLTLQNSARNDAYQTTSGLNDYKARDISWV